MLKVIKDFIESSEFILIGIGEDFSQNENTSEDKVMAYNLLSNTLGNKDYFVVTLQTDDLIYDSELKQEQIVAPCGSEKSGNVVSNPDFDESCYLPQWEIYKKWLQNTLNHSLCILELGVGFQYPTVIRFPFEKIGYFNQKSHFIRINRKFYQLTPEIKERGTALSESPIKVVLDL